MEERLTKEEWANLLLRQMDVPAKRQIPPQLRMVIETIAKKVKAHNKTVANDIGRLREDIAALQKQVGTLQQQRAVNEGVASGQIAELPALLRKQK